MPSAVCYILRYNSTVAIVDCTAKEKYEHIRNILSLYQTSYTYVELAIYLIWVKKNNDYTLKTYPNQFICKPTCLYAHSDYFPQFSLYVTKSASRNSVQLMS